VMSYRGTFSSQIQESGIEGLIKTLSEKNAGSGESGEMVKTEAK